VKSPLVANVANVGKVDMADLAAELTADHEGAARANGEDPAEQLAWRRLAARHGDRLGAITAGPRRPWWGRARPALRG
jgi:hypothetical protein